MKHRSKSFESLSFNKDTIVTNKNFWLNRKQHDDNSHLHATSKQNIFPRNENRPTIDIPYRKSFNVNIEKNSLINEPCYNLPIFNVKTKDFEDEDCIDAFTNNILANNTIGFKSFMASTFRIDSDFLTKFQEGSLLINGGCDNKEKSPKKKNSNRKDSNTSKNSDDSDDETNNGGLKTTENYSELYSPCKTEQSPLIKNGKSYMSGQAGKLKQQDSTTLANSQSNNGFFSGNWLNKDLINENTSRNKDFSDLDSDISEEVKTKSRVNTPIPFEVIQKNVIKNYISDKLAKKSSNTIENDNFLDLLMELFYNNLSEEREKDVVFIRRKSLDSGSDYYGKTGNKMKRFDYSLDFWNMFYEFIVRYQLKQSVKKSLDGKLQNETDKDIIIPDFQKNNKLNHNKSLHEKPNNKGSKLNNDQCQTNNSVNQKNNLDKKYFVKKEGKSSNPIENLGLSPLLKKFVSKDSINSNKFKPYDFSPSKIQTKIGDLLQEQVKNTTKTFEEKNIKSIKKSSIDINLESSEQLDYYKKMLERYCSPEFNKKLETMEELPESQTKLDNKTSRLNEGSSHVKFHAEDKHRFTIPKTGYDLKKSEIRVLSNSSCTHKKNFEQKKPDSLKTSFILQKNIQYLDDLKDKLKEDIELQKLDSSLALRNLNIDLLTKDNIRHSELFLKKYSTDTKMKKNYYLSDSLKQNNEGTPIKDRRISTRFNNQISDSQQKYIFNNKIKDSEPKFLKSMKTNNNFASLPLFPLANNSQGPECISKDQIRVNANHFSQNKISRTGKKESLNNKYIKICQNPDLNIIDESHKQDFRNYEPHNNIRHKSNDRVYIAPTKSFSKQFQLESTNAKINQTYKIMHKNSTRKNHLMNSCSPGKTFNKSYNHDDLIQSSTITEYKQKSLDRKVINISYENKSKKKFSNEFVKNFANSSKQKFKTISIEKEVSLKERMIVHEGVKQYSNEIMDKNGEKNKSYESGIIKNKTSNNSSKEVINISSTDKAIFSKNQRNQNNLPLINSPDKKLESGQRNGKAIENDNLRAKKRKGKNTNDILHKNLSYINNNFTRSNHDNDNYHKAFDDEKNTSSINVNQKDSMKFQNLSYNNKVINYKKNVKKRLFSTIETSDLQSNVLFNKKNENSDKISNNEQKSSHELNNAPTNKDFKIEGDANNSFKNTDKIKNLENLTSTPSIQKKCFHARTNSDFIFKKQNIRKNKNLFQAQTQRNLNNANNEKDKPIAENSNVSSINSKNDAKNFVTSLHIKSDSMGMLSNTNKSTLKETGFVDSSTKLKLNSEKSNFQNNINLFSQSGIETIKESNMHKFNKIKTKPLVLDNNSISVNPYQEKYFKIESVKLKQMKQKLMIHRVREKNCLANELNSFIN